MILVLALLCWDPVLTNCDGGPETIAAYVDETAYVRIVRWDVCAMDDGTTYPCPVYLVEPFTLLATDPDPCVPDVPAPGPGEVLLIRTTAVDTAGNLDCGT